MRKIILLFAVFLFTAIFASAQTITYNTGSGTLEDRLMHTNNPPPSPPVAGQQNESYDACWIFSDGHFLKNPSTQQITSVTGGTVIKLSSATTYATCYSVDKYGDDNDYAVMVSGGKSPAPMYDESVVQPLTTLSGTTQLYLQNAHTSNKVATGDTILLIITAGNYANESDFLVSLSYDPSALKYIAAVNDATPNATPAGQSKYSSFADLTTNNTQSGALGWTLKQADLSASEKNIYVAFSVIGQSGNSTTLTAQFKGKTQNGIPPVQSQMTLDFQRSFDPNYISVDKQYTGHCHECGVSGDWVTYEVHFQNTGEAAAKNIEINFKADPNLDLSTLEVLRACIGEYEGTSYNEEGAPGAGLPQGKPLVSEGGGITDAEKLALTTADFYWWLSPSGSDLLYPGRCTTWCDASGNCFSPVMRDACFIFRNINLSGTGEPHSVDLYATMGYVKFRIKTNNTYSKLLANAGIVFDCNPEVVTKESVFTCQGCGKDVCPSEPKWPWIAGIIAAFLVGWLGIKAFRKKP